VLKARAEELTRLRRAVLSVSEDLITAESTLAEDRASLERQLREKTALERQLDADVTDYQRRANVLAGQLRSLGASTTGPVLRPAVQGPRVLQAPVQGSLMRRFGQPAPEGRAADGMTWRTAPGAPVRAPASGTVEFAGPLKGWGGVVILDVGGGYHLVMAGLDRISPQVGKPMSSGQPVGAMAQAGSPELYLELRRDGAPIDPARWLR
jgi:septal ring factor EnvC (AmiA/AmiB activator)